MSYILDALRKAESERERESAATGAPLTTPAPHAAPPSSLMHRLWPGLALGVVLGAAGLFAWHAWRAGHEPAASMAAQHPPAIPAAGTPPAVALPPLPPPETVAGTEAPVVTDQVPSPAPPVARPRTPRTPPRAERADGPAQDIVQMPDDIRRTLPPMAFGGAMYSDKASSRMLIINGRLFHEGDAITPELTLDTIQLKSAVLRYRGQRYNVNY